MAHQAFSSLGLHFPSGVFSAFFRQLVLNESCGLEIAKTCNGPNFQPSSAFITRQCFKQVEKITVTLNQLKGAVCPGKINAVKKQTILSLFLF